MPAEGDLQAPDAADLRLIEHLHDGFPLAERPFAQVAAELDSDEQELLGRLRRLREAGVLTRFGPLFQIERAGGSFVLAAIAVPEQRFDEVAAIVNALPEVAHNYRREHALNMWFVIAAVSDARAQAALASITERTGLRVLALPKQREYFVELRLALSSAAQAGRPARPRAEAAAPASGPPRRQLEPFEQRLIRATQEGLPLVERPYDAVGVELGVTGATVRAALAAMLDSGLVRRIGAVPNHYRLGWLANGMTVWDVDDERVDELGQRVGALDGVSHCYRRPRVAPQWRYNLFAMLHGRTRAEVERQRGDLRALLGRACRADDILYSTAILKKTGLRLGEG